MQPGFNDCTIVPSEPPPPPNPNELAGSMPYGIQWLRFNKGHWFGSESYYISPRKSSDINNAFELHGDEWGGILSPLGGALAADTMACHELGDGRARITCDAIGAALIGGSYGAAKDAARNAAKDGSRIKVRMWGEVLPEVDKTAADNKFCRAVALTDR